MFYNRAIHTCVIFLDKNYGPLEYDIIVTVVSEDLAASSFMAAQGLNYPDGSNKLL